MKIETIKTKVSEKINELLETAPNYAISFLILIATFLVVAACIGTFLLIGSIILWLPLTKWIFFVLFLWVIIHSAIFG